MPSDLSNYLNYIGSESRNSDSNDTSEKEEEIFEKQKNYVRFTFDDLKKTCFITYRLRIYLVIWSSLTATYWIWKVGEILVNNNDYHCLSDTVLNVLLGTSTLIVIGIATLVMYNVFNEKYNHG